MRRLLALALLCLGCYSPDVASGKFACAQDLDCPGPLVCRATVKGLRCVDAATPAPGACAAEGFPLSATVSACRGSFDAGGAAQLCRKGAHLCGTKDGDLGLGAVCDAVMGFFASRVPVEKVREPAMDRPYDIGCDIGGGVDMPYGLLGCGSETGARGIGSRGGDCPSLPAALRCDRAASWTCGAEGLDRAAYDGKGGGGVLCCAD